MDYSTDTLSNEGIGVIIFAIFIILFVFFAFFLNSYLLFKEKRAYIKMEMERSFKEKEYLYWKRELRRLYISKIPIARTVVRRKDRR